MNVAVHPAVLSAGRFDVLSLCTGGGGLDLGLELALPGARAVCMVEREAFAVAHLVAAMRAGLMDEAPIWSDARTFDGRAWRGCVDGLIGGIPCQPHSLAGKRLAEEDERDLWSTARRIIVQSRPWFVLIENVGGMLSSGGAERVWRDLRRLGYAVEIGLFTAAEVDASHERERLFILAVADAGCSGRQQIARSAHGDEGPYEGRPSPQHHFVERLGESVADACSIRSAAGFSGQERPRQGGIAAEPDDDRHALVDAEGVRRREGRAEPKLRGRRGATAFDGGLFPPGPHERERWRDVLARSPELEPAFRRVADGLASRLDFARVDRLRLLGNGVVPLEAGYAVRTLATRLARRSAGAGQFVRMMS
jgi:DNA (cytosine-5)-methyltransferase 1